MRYCTRANNEWKMKQFSEMLVNFFYYLQGQFFLNSFFVVVERRSISLQLQVNDVEQK